MHRNRCNRYLRILVAINQGRGGLHELPPQTTALIHAADDGRRPLTSLAEAAEDGQHSPIAHADNHPVPHNLNFWQARSFCAVESAARTRARARSQCWGPWQSKREGHALPSDGSGGKSYLLSHRPPPLADQHLLIIFFNLRVFIKE